MHSYTWNVRSATWLLLHEHGFYKMKRLRYLLVLVSKPGQKVKSNRPHLKCYTHGHFEDVFRRHNFVLCCAICQTICPITNSYMKVLVRWVGHLSHNIAIATFRPGKIFVLFYVATRTSWECIHTSIVLVRRVGGFSLLLAAFPVDVIWAVANTTLVSSAYLASRPKVQDCRSSFLIGWVAFRLWGWSRR